MTELRTLCKHHFTELVFCHNHLNKVFNLGLSDSASKLADLLNPVRMVPYRKLNYVFTIYIYKLYFYLTGYKIPVLQLLHKHDILHAGSQDHILQHWQGDPEQCLHPKAYILFTVEDSQSRRCSLSFPGSSPAYKSSGKLLRKFLLSTSSLELQDSKTFKFSFKQYWVV